MKAWNHAEVERLKCDIPFYNFNDLTIIEGTSYIIKISAKSSCMRYGDIELGNCSFWDYYQQEESLLNFLISFFDTIPEEECIIIKYEPEWVVQGSESPKLASYLRENGINNDVCGITVNKYDVLVREFITSAFRYNSFIQLLFFRQKVIITPTDHMDMFLDLPTSGPLIDQIDVFLNSKGRPEDGVIVSPNTT